MTAARFFLLQAARGLALAAKHGHHTIVAALVGAGISAQPLLIRAAAAGDSEQLMVLIKGGAAADLDVASEAMLSAGCNGHRGVVQLLLNAGASVFKQDRSHGRNVLHLASAHGHAPVVRTILAAGAPINACDPDGCTALQLAVAGSHVAVVEELLRSGAALERRGISWEAALAEATDSQVRALLIAERSRRTLESELCTMQEAVEKGKSRKSRKKESARAAAAEAKAAAAAAEREKAAEAEQAEEEAEAAEAEAAEAAAELEAMASAAASPARSPAARSPSSRSPSKSGARSSDRTPRTSRNSGGSAYDEAAEQEEGAEAARDRATFEGGGDAAGDGSRPVDLSWISSDLVAAGGSVASDRLDMESLARQAASFRRAGLGRPGAAEEGGASGQPAAGLPPPGGTAGGGGLPPGLHTGFAQPIRPSSAIGVASDAAYADPIAGPPPDAAAAEGVAALRAEVAELQLRVASEQQCVLREQHIVARMWIEKSRAEETAEAAAKRAAELESTVAGWESWHLSQRKQQRARRQAAVRQAPDQMLRNLLSDWGVVSATALKPEERTALASNLEAAAAAIRHGTPSRPPGL